MNKYLFYLLLLPLVGCGPTIEERVEQAQALAEDADYSIEVLKKIVTELESRIEEIEYRLDN